MGATIPPTSNVNRIRAEGVVSTIAALATVSSIFLLLWQNLLLQQQILQQTLIADTNRRAELIATLYNKRDCDAADIETCPSTASIRARVEAAIAFVQLERVSDPRHDVIGDAGKVNLTSADLSGGFMPGADLSGTNLWGSSLRSAYLVGANLSDAHLSGTSLRGADLSDTDLSGSLLLGTDLSDANLSSANLDGALYDDTTIWPEGFDAKASGAILQSE